MTLFQNFAFLRDFFIYLSIYFFRHSFMLANTNENTKVQEQKPNIKTFKVMYTSLLILCVFLYFLYFIGILQHSIRIIGYPYAVDYVEWPEISRAVQILEGNTVYSSWEELPLRVANYPPLFTFVHAFGIWCTSATPMIGRCIALLCTLSIMVLIGLIVHTETKKQIPHIIIPVFAGLFYASSHMTWLWSSLVRVDNLAVALALLSIHLHTSKSNSFSKYAIVFCAFALFTKQTMLAAPIAILGSTFLLHREQLQYKIGLFLGWSIFLYGTLFIATQGKAYDHLIIANINTFDWNMFFAFSKDLWTMYHWLLIVVCFGIYALRSNITLLIYIVLSTVLSISIAKVGSSLNYLLEFWAAICLLSGYALYLPFTFTTSWKRYGSAITIVFSLLYGWQHIFHVPWEKKHVGEQKMKAMALGTWNDVAQYSTYLPFHYLNPWSPSPIQSIKRNVKFYVPTPAQWEFEMMSDINSYVQHKLPKPILSEDMNFYSPTQGEDIMLQSFEMHQLYLQDHFDQKILHTCLQKSCVQSLILMFDIYSNNINYVSKQRFSTQTIALMQQKYQPVTQLGPYFFYVKKEQQ